VAANGTPAAPAALAGQTLRGLDRLEAQIDDALALAKHLDRDRLHDVIRLLRTARNRVVVMLG
jgi:hypothetical protein